MKEEDFQRKHSFPKTEFGAFDDQAFLILIMAFQGYQRPQYQNTKLFLNIWKSFEKKI